MRTPNPTPEPGITSPRTRAIWTSAVALALVVVLLVALPLTLWRQWENAAVPAALETSTIRASKKAQSGRIKSNTAASGASQPESPVTQFIYTNPAGVELARMVPVALQGLGAANPAGDERKLLVTVAIRNTGDQSLQLSPELFSLIDSDGVSHPVSTTPQRIKTGIAPSRTQRVRATPAAAERARTTEPKPTKVTRDRKADPESENARRAATPAAIGTRAGSGAANQRAERNKDAPTESAPAAVALERQVVPPGGELRAGLSFALPDSARPGDLIFSPEPDRPLVVADLNALLNGQGGTRDAVSERTRTEGSSAADGASAS